MAQGFIDRIDAKETQFGKMYDVVIGGTKYGVGKFPPKGVAAGDYVQYEPVQKGNYWNIAPGSLSKLPQPAGVTPAPAARAAAPMAPDRRQETISKQAALNSALSFLNILVASDALPGGKALKADKKADMLLAVLEEYTGRFYHQSTGETFEFPDSPAGSSMDLSKAEEDGAWSEE